MGMLASLAINAWKSPEGLAEGSGGSYLGRGGIVDDSSIPSPRRVVVVATASVASIDMDGAHQLRSSRLVYQRTDIDGRHTFFVASAMRWSY